MLLIAESGVPKSESSFFLVNSKLIQIIKRFPEKSSSLLTIGQTIKLKNGGRC